MYVIDRDTTWYDYDLTSAYSTGMALLGTPNFTKAYYIDSNFDFKSFIESKAYLNCFSAMKVSFNYPLDVKYPNIPSTVSKDITVYPLRGESIISIIELKVALSLNCDIRIIEGVIVPFELNYSSNKVYNGDFDNYRRPNFNEVKTLQDERRKYPKMTFENLFYKLIGNGLYGQTAKGLSNKKY